MRKERWIKVAVSLVLAVWILVLAGVIPSLSSERAMAAARTSGAAVRTLTQTD